MCVVFGAQGFQKSSHGRRHSPPKAYVINVMLFVASCFCRACKGTVGASRY